VIARIEHDGRIDNYMSLDDPRVAKIIEIMKTRGWAYVRHIPSVEITKHRFCVLHISDVSQEFQTVQRVGGYIFNFSLVEEKTMIPPAVFEQVADGLKRVREPVRGFVGPLPKDEMTYNMLKIDDQLSPLPPSTGWWK